ncbi:MAG: hypothetical protein A2341_27590 [Deltaproteobacteria bacterium RIFOXYB12_FULL_58_9]|nr:MAG: hypothetical protein A2341_27590 [Deltaproteobacteria bacterium RIFOXYB12_FULL_58_9]
MRARLGELLVQAGVLSRKQIEAALEHQRHAVRRPKLGEVILQLGLTTEDVILDVLSRALHLPAIDLIHTTPTQEALRTVSVSEAFASLMIPVRLEREGHRRRLVLAMADPTNIQLIDNLQFKTGMVVRPLVSTATQVRQAIEQHYKVPHSPMSAAAMPGGEAATWVGDAPGRESTSEVAAAELIVVSGPAKGQRHWLKAGKSIDFGRGENVEVSIPGDMRMSRRHFILVDAGDAIELVDLGGVNGTVLNQQRVRRAVIKSGDFIGAGETIIEVRLLSRR